MRKCSTRISTEHWHSDWTRSQCGWLIHLLSYTSYTNTRELWSPLSALSSYSWGNWGSEVSVTKVAMKSTRKGRCIPLRFMARVLKHQREHLRASYVLLTWGRGEIWVWGDDARMDHRLRRCGISKSGVVGRSSRSMLQRPLMYFE